MALLALRDIGAKEPYEVMIDNRKEELTLKEYYERLRKSDWQPEWHKVLDCALENIKESSDYSNYNNKVLLEQLENMWSKYLSKAYPLVPHIEETEVWSGALEYLTLLKMGAKTNYKEVALRYAVSPRSLLEKYRIISAMIHQ